MLTSDLIVAGFGVGLSATTELASLPLPNSLAGRRVLVKDITGLEKAAKLLFVAPGQINYIVPEGLADGPAVISLIDENNNLVRIDLAEIRKVSPGIFTANSDGLGVPAAIITRVKPGNEHITEQVAQLDEARSRFVPFAD